MTGSQNNAQIDKRLTQLSNKITPSGYISEQILPMVNVVQSTGKIGQYGTSHLRITNTLTIGKNKYPEVQTRVYNDLNYDIETHGLVDYVTMRDKANVEDPFNAEVDTTNELVTKLWLGKEKSLADALTNTSVLTNNVTLSGTDQLNDYANSDPIGVFQDARQSIRSKTGMLPDTIIMSYPTYDQIRYHPAILEVGYKYNRSGELSETELARVFGVNRILLGTAIYNSANEGQADDIQDVWSKDIIFGVCPTAAARGQVSLGYRFQQFGAPHVVQKSQVTNPRGATQITVDDSYDQVVTQVDAGYLIKGAIA